MKKYMLIGAAGALVVLGLPVAVFVDTGLGFAIVGLGVGVGLIYFSMGSKTGCLTMLAFLICMVTFICTFARGSIVRQRMVDERYLQALGDPQALFSQLESNDSGTKYVLYDEDEGVFLHNIVPSEYEANAAWEVANVIKLRKDKDLVGTYSFAGSSRGISSWAYRHEYIFSLMDTDMETVLYESTVYGGDPPRTVKSGYKYEMEHFGSEPTKDQMQAACEELIRAKEGN